MKIVILFTLLLTALALPPPDHILKRVELNTKAKEVEEFVVLLDKIKCIALMPRDEADWEQPDSIVRDIEAFIATIDLIKNTENDNHIKSEILPNEELIYILDHLRSWVLATSGDMEQLDIQGHDKANYKAVLSLIEEIENYVSDVAHKNEAFFEVLNWLRNYTLTTGGDWDQIPIEYIEENDKEAFQALFDVIGPSESIVYTDDNFV